MQPPRPGNQIPETAKGHIHTLDVSDDLDDVIAVARGEVGLCSMKSCGRNLSRLLRRLVVRTEFLVRLFVILLDDVFEHDTTAAHVF